MSIQLKQFKHASPGCNSYALYESFNCEFLNYEACSFNEKEIKEYEKDNPYPKKETEYEFKDLIYDFTVATGSITFICKLEETAEWIADMVYQLL